MTGQTHWTISGTGVAAAWTLGDLDSASALLLLAGATMAASGPDRIEKPFGAKHREWTHLLLTGLVAGLLVGLAVFFLPQLAVHLAAPADPFPADVEAMLGLVAFWLAAGVTLGWWLHSLADACTDGGCWLIAHRDVWLLPEKLRIKAYTIKTKRSWLTGKPKRDRRTGKIKTTKKPSLGEKTYRRGAVAATCAIVAVHLATKVLDLLDAMSRAPA